MTTLHYMVTVFGNGKNHDSFSYHGSKENAIVELKTMAYELLGGFVGDNYSIEEMSETSFILNIEHDDGTTENYSLSID